MTVTGQVLQEWLAEPNPALLAIVDPRPYIRTTGTVQNTYAVSLLQAETLAAAVSHDWPIRFGDPDSTTAHVDRAAHELGLDLAVLTS